MKTILAIEDDPAIRAGLEALLTVHGFAVETRDDGAQGLARAMEAPPDCILLDVSLPSMDGLEVCRRLREMGSITPIIMLTARAEQIDKVIGLEVGADDYITKPFDQRELVSRIRAHLRRAERLMAAPKPTDDHDTPRRLFTVMFTDLKDYSKMMHEDEDLGIRVLRSHNDMMRQVIARHHGRVSDVIGDAFVVAFTSALDAVECAVEIQRTFLAYNTTVPLPESIVVRIGIHLGDVAEVDGKLIGDAVNIAARLQQYSPPGSVFISQSVQESIRSKVHLSAENRGAIALKNISAPVDVYEIRVMYAGKIDPSTSGPPVPPGREER